MQLQGGHCVFTYLPSWIWIIQRVLHIGVICAATQNSQYRNQKFSPVGRKAEEVSESPTVLRNMLCLFFLSAVCILSSFWNYFSVSYLFNLIVKLHGTILYLFPQRDEGMQETVVFWPNKKGLLSYRNRNRNRNGTDVDNDENFILCPWGHLMWNQKHS